MQGDEGAEEPAAQPCDSSKPIEGDCPICYDEMNPGGSTAEVSCRTLPAAICRASWRFWLRVCLWQWGPCCLLLC